MNRNQINWPAWIVTQSKHGMAMVFGSPGTGKTAIAGVASEMFGMDGLNVLKLGQMMPEDICGPPLKSHVTFGGTKHECVRYIKNEQMLKLKHGKYLTLVDECNHATRATQAAAQEEIFNQQPENGYIIGIANPPEIATDGYEFSAPVVNRMCILEWETDLSSWQEGMATNEFPEPNIPVLPDDWTDLIPKWKFLVGEFSKEGGAEFFVESETFPKKAEDWSKPWCSHRSWYNAAVNLAAAESVGANESTTTKILTGFVGEGAASVFMHWHKSIGLPTSSDFYNRPEETAHKLPRRFDTAVACVKGVLCYAKQKIDEAGSDYDANQSWEKGLDFAEIAFKHNREVISASVGSFIKLKPASHKPAPRSSELWDSVSEVRKEVMQGA